MARNPIHIADISVSLTVEVHYTEEAILSVCLTVPGKEPVTVGELLDEGDYHEIVASMEKEGYLSVDEAYSIRFPKLLK